MQQAMDASVPAPINLTAQLPPGLSLVASTASRLDFQSVLERLDGFMKIANLAAEVCQCHVADNKLKAYLSHRSTHWLNSRGGLCQSHTR